MSLKDKSSIVSRLLKERLSSLSFGQPLKVWASSLVIRLFLQSKKYSDCTYILESKNLSSVLNFQRSKRGHTTTCPRINLILSNSKMLK